MSKMHINLPYRGDQGLPVTKNMPYITASMPSRQQPRNMTGIYLGLEGNIRPPASDRSAVPPLARGRGLSSRIRTPAEERRYKMVEVLRLKEEKKGFSGQPLRKRMIKSASPSREHLTSAKRWGPAKRIDSRNVDDLIKTNPRRYTHIANSGVTRSENLTGWMDYENGEMKTPMMHLPDHVIESATTGEDLTGLEECYRKGSIETLHSLLPPSAPTVAVSSANQNHHRGKQERSGQERSAYNGTGFSVRSYRNPNQAEIVADFPLPRTTGRPQTVPIRRPHVPQPYFFQFYNQSKLIASNTAHFHKINAPAEDGGHAVRILASPGVGTLSRTLHLQSPSDPNHYPHTKESPSPIPSFVRAFHGAAADSQQLEISMPLSGKFQVNQDLQTTPSVTIGQTEESDSRVSNRSESDENKMDDGYLTGGGCDSVVTDTKEYQDELFVGRTLKSSSSGADITVGLEKEDGTADEVEIDDVEAAGAALEPVETESPKGNVRKASIVDKLVKTKQSEAIIATLKENAEQRQKDFQKLLNEHAEIVQEIGRTASSENLISQAEHGERDH